MTTSEGKTSEAFKRSRLSRRSVTLPQPPRPPPPRWRPIDRRPLLLHDLGLHLEDAGRLPHAPRLDP